jgi:thiosulfate reductase/polysulfide reductase chain A
MNVRVLWRSDEDDEIFTIERKTAMSEKALTRRSFLAGSAGAVALAGAAGFMGFGAWEQAHADSRSTAKTVTTAHSLCGGCSSKCGYTAYVSDGKLIKQLGDEGHPYSRGKLCARGYGYANIAYSEDRLTDPLKRNAQGKFEKIDWDTAISEISDKVKSIISSSGAKALALVHDPRPSGKYYGPRFMQALGSANVYTHGAACYLSRTSGFKQVVGGGWTSDVAHSKMTMFIGRSYADGVRPSQVADIEAAHANGADLVIVDPRLNSTALFATEWVPIKPGTDLALVLGMSNELVRNGRYDADFVAANVEGFEDWKKAITPYTAEWAEGVCGVPADKIASLAARMAAAAPACSIEPSWRAAFGCQYANSGETARAIAVFNSLLGVWNQEGGALFLPSVKAGALDQGKFPNPPAVSEKAYGLSDLPLASESSALSVAEGARTGDIKGVFFYNSNMVAGYQNPTYLGECFDRLDLCVVIDVLMSETAQHADYVLPECSYLERFELPEFVSASTPVVSLRDQVLDVIHPNTKPVDEIFTLLANACGVGKYFDFTVEELADAQLRTVGLTLDGLRTAGTQSFPEKAFVAGTTPKFNTSDGKIHFTSDACAKAGYPAAPEWTAPVAEGASDELRLIGGKQAIHCHNQSVDVAALMNITKDYGLERVWISSEDAAARGISDGDTVRVSNAQSDGKVKAHVTERLTPGCVWMPSHYGCAVPEQKNAYNVGLRQMDFVPFRVEPGYGGACTQEAFVKVEKVG